MKPSVAAATLGIAESTIRKYATDYGDFLSPAGAGGDRKHRDFDERDVRVLKLIRDMYAAGTNADDMDVTLQSLKSSDWERLPQLDETARSIVPAPGALMEANRHNDLLQGEINVLREQLEKAEARNAADRQEVIDLQRKLAQAELRIELLNSGELKPKG
jgi:DNA-binding transcriptional MerR regulator